MYVTKVAFGGLFGTEKWFFDIITKNSKQAGAQVKKLFAALIGTISLIAGPQPNIKSSIESVHGTEAILNTETAPIGSSAIVVHRFDEEHSTIVAGAEVVGKNRIKFKVFGALEQEALPSPKILPQKGDLVILNYLYDRGVIIAPDLKSYNYALSNHPEIEWMHPDLFAAQLAAYQNPAPTIEDFQKFCNDYSVGVVYFVLKNRGVLTDCQTLKPIHIESISPKAQKTKLPFYSRIKKIESSWFDFFGKSKIEDYYNYYTKLLELK